MHLRHVAATSLAALAILAPGQAWAGTHTSTDPTGDVVQNPQSPGQAVMPDRADGDITSSTVTFRHNRVDLTLQHRALATPTDLKGYVFELETKHRTRDLQIVTDADHPAGQAMLMKPSGRPVRCNVSFAIDYTAATVTASVPRRCLGKAQWVRVGMGTVVMEGSDFYADDALTNADIRDNVTMGPKVHRG